MAKRYYWLKLKNDFFKSKLMKKLRKISGGDTFTIIYLKMQLLSIQDEGKLFYEGVESSFEEELALELDENVDNVRVTVSFLKSCGLLKQESGEVYLLTEVPFLIGSETASAQRGKEYRANLTDEQKEKERERARLGMAKMRAERKEKENVTACYERVTNVEIEKEIEIEKEKDIYSDIDIKERDRGKPHSHSNDKPKRKVFTPPTVEEVKQYCQERNNNVDAETFVDFYECKGWMVGKNKMKDWKAAIRTWERKDNYSRPKANTNKTTVTDHKDTKSAAMEIFGEF